MLGFRDKAELASGWLHLTPPSNKKNYPQVEGV
jgi:hypothetical protein